MINAEKQEESLNTEAVGPGTEEPSPLHPPSIKDYQ